MRTVSWILTALLLLAPATQAFAAGQGSERQATPIEKIKVKVAKLGVGEKAKANVTTRDGAKTKGYVYRAGDDDFEIRDRKTGASTTIRYDNVARVDDGRGHSTARNILIAVGVGAGVALIAVYAAIARNEQ
jgi:hypothetical protein